MVTYFPRICAPQFAQRPRTAHASPAPNTVMNRTKSNSRYLMCLTYHISLCCAKAITPQELEENMNRKPRESLDSFLLWAYVHFRNRRPVRRRQTESRENENAKRRSNRTDGRGADDRPRRGILHRIGRAGICRRRLGPGVRLWPRLGPGRRFRPGLRPGLGLARRGRGRAGRRPGAGRAAAAGETAPGGHGT